MKKNKYVFFVVLIIIAILLIYCSPCVDADKFGTAADWISGIGTASAFIWGVLALDKQTNIDRALNIENQRPRFSFEQTDNFQKGDIVLRPNGSDEFTPEGIEKLLKNTSSGFLFRVNNISENMIYSLEIIIRYDNTLDSYKYHGVHKGGTLIIAPSNLIKNWQSLLIKFCSPVNEIGYMYCESGSEAKYYFIKDKNSYVSVYGNDKLVDTTIKKYEDEFSKNKPSLYNFTSKKDVSREAAKTQNTKEGKED